MDVSSLPTDNLYKFLAISGLLIFGFSYAAPEYISFQLEMKKSEVISNQQKIIIEGELIELELEKLRIDRKFREILLKEQPIDQPTNTNELINEIKTAQLAYSELIDKNKSTIAWQKKVRDQEMQIDQIKIITEKINEHSLHAKLGRIIGLLMTLSGFALWYCKTQRHIDSSTRSISQ